MRFTLAGVDDPKAQHCIAHRCEEHQELQPVNSNGPSGSECGACVGQAFAEAYEKTVLKAILWPLVETARNRLNLLSPGAGDTFQDHARVTVNSLKILSEVAQIDEDQTDKLREAAECAWEYLDGTLGKCEPDCGCVLHGLEEALGKPDSRKR